MGEGDKFYSLGEYEVIGEVGEFIEKDKGSVVSMLIRKRWKGKYVVIERC